MLPFELGTGCELAIGPSRRTGIRFYDRFLLLRVLMKSSATSVFILFWKAVPGDVENER